MRALALALVVSACMPPPKPPMDPLTKLLVRREERTGHQSMAVIGLAIGVVTTLAGGILLDRGIELRASEATADSEGGLGELLAGMMLTGSGIIITGASGIVLGVATHDIAEINDELRAMSP